MLAYVENSRYGRTNYRMFTNIIKKNYILGTKISESNEIRMSSINIITTEYEVAVQFLKKN